MVICLEQDADLHMAQLMPLPLTVSCFSKIQIGFTFPIPAHLGSPGKGPLNGCVCVCTTLHLFNGLFSRTTWASQYQKGETSRDLNEARVGVLRCSGISWTTCKQSAPHSRQITIPTPHCSIFTDQMLLPKH